VIQRLMQRTTYTASCLSPVHIGSGNRFGKFDGAHVSGKWSVIDLDKVLEKDIDPTSLAQAMNDRDFNWQNWLNRHKIKLAEVSAYSIPCLVPPAENEIRAAVKDADLRPYLPGSSVKGALRTAIVWGLLKNDDEAVRLTGQHLQHLAYSSDRAPQFPALPMEQYLLGEDPNHDLMRALRVIDSATVSVDQLAVGLVWTYSLGNNKMVEKRENGREFKTFVEWLKPETRLTMEIGVDAHLLTVKEPVPGGKPRPLFTPAQQEAVNQLAKFCNDYARAVIAVEQQFLADHWSNDLNFVKQFYDDRAAELETMPAGSFLLNTGWGGGWEAKTVGDQMRAALPEADFQQLRQRYQLGQKPSSSREDLTYLNHYFPHSRHIGYKGVPRWPLGWLKLDFFVA